MVSIVMATYNGDRYVEEQIDSILNQTYKDIELVVCDDCSTDSTWTILQSYANKDKRIHIYRNEKNLGYLKNFEKVMSLATGEYVALSDQDDVWTPDHVKYLMNNMGDAVFSCANANMISGEGTPLGRDWDRNYLSSERPQNDLYKLSSIFYVDGAYQGASMLFRRELLNVVLPFPGGIVYHDMWVSMNACLYGGINYSNRIITGYRIHGGNLSGDHISKPCKLRKLLRIALIGPLNDMKPYFDGLTARFRSYNPSLLFVQSGGGKKQEVRLYDDRAVLNILETIRKSAELKGVSRILYNSYLVLFKRKLFFYR